MIIGLLVAVLVLSGCTQQIGTPPPTPSPTPPPTTKICEDGTIVEISEQCQELIPEPNPEPIPETKIHNQSISGEIMQNQTWSGNIHVTGDIDVRGGATLTILPGTIIKIAAFSDDQHKGIDRLHDPPFPKDPDRLETQSTQIRIAGILNAVGTSEKMIVFTSDSENPTTYDWDGLVINHGRLEYAIVEYSRYNNIQESSDVVIANSIFRNMLECCIGIGHSKPVSPQILDNDIYNCGHEGIDYAGGSALIKGNYFHQENREIQPDPQRGGLGIVVYKNAYPIIEDNNFEKNSIGILFSNNSLNEKEEGKKTTLRNNTMEKNGENIVIDSGYPVEEIVIENQNAIIN